MRYLAHLSAVDLALLSVRMGLGLLFLTVGAAKFADTGRFQKLVFASNLLEPPWAEVYAAVTPAWDLVIGVGCLLGWATRAAGGLALLELAAYVIYVWVVAPAAAGVPGRPPWATTGGLFSREAAQFFSTLALIPCALSLVLAGGGAYSVDTRRTRRRGGAAAPRRLSRIAVGLMVLTLLTFGVLVHQARARSLGEAREAECLGALTAHRQAYAARATLTESTLQEQTEGRVRAAEASVRTNCS